MLPVDWFIYGVIIGVMLVIFFLYLMLRRSVLGFKEGFKDNQR